MSYETLIAEHAKIDAALDRMRALVEPAAPDVPAVVLALSALAGELHHHLAHEDSFIYPRMIAGRSAESAAAAHGFIVEFAELRRDWGLYLGEWDSECIAADWAGFQAETQRMIARLADRVKAENELLYNVALQSGAIRLRDAA
jgi:hypothetical protein